MKLTLKTKDEIEIFDNYQLTSPDDVKKAILQAVSEAESDLFGAPQDIALKKVKIDLLNRFYQTVKGSILFDYSGTGWCYWIYITCRGVELHFGHCCSCTVENEHCISAVYDSNYCILVTESRMLTLEEYSKIVGVKAATLRQWIKRGKLRTAVKYGDEWRVPEYTQLPQYGYVSGEYSVKENSSVSFPEKFHYLSQAELFIVYQDMNKGGFHISDCKAGKTYDITSKEREELELFCQLNPDIEYKTPMSEIIRHK